MNPLTCDEVRELAAEYVLDGLDASVSAAIREHLAIHPDGHPEFVELAGPALALAYITDPVSPPPDLKKRVLATAAATTQAATARSGSALDAPGSAAPGSGGVVEPRGRQPAERQGWRAAIKVRRLTVARWAFATAAIAFIVALVFANASLQRDVSSATQFSDQFHRAVALAAAPGSRLAVIGTAVGTGGSAGSAVPTGPNGLAVIPQGGPGILVMQGLGATDGSQVYEAWAIVGTEAPVPIGSFGVGSNGFGWLTELTVPAGGSVVVALTREPGPGATKPTLPIVASGTAAPRS
jgi:hypothetical protein